MEKHTTAKHTASQERSAHVKAGICRLLKCTESEYAQRVYEEGLRFLHHYLADDQESISKLERSRLFWNWWKNRWTNTDLNLLDAAPGLDSTRMHQIYTDLHDSRQCREQMPRFVFDEVKEVSHE